MTKQVAFHVPTRPYSPIDALNRMAAALGSPRYGMLAAHANYNGHRIEIRWNSYRGYYTAHYMWSGPNWIARGSFESCLRAALRYYDEGALGASVTIELREGDEEALALCKAEPRVVSGSEDVRSWHTWRHDVAARCARDYTGYGHPYLFDWDLLQAAENEADYTAKLKAKHGRVYG